MTTKPNFSPLILLFVVLLSCQASLYGQSCLETGMFKVAILYPNGDDKTFDMDYYEEKHMPMVAGFLGKNLRLYEIDKGIAGRATGEKAPFVAVGYFYIDDVAEYNKAIGQNRDTILNDIKKYTNIQPIIQISEIRQLKK